MVQVAAGGERPAKKLGRRPRAIGALPFTRQAPPPHKGASITQGSADGMSGQGIRRLQPGARMSQGAVHGGLVFLAGQVAESAAGAGVTAQTQGILGQVDRLLAEAGTDKTRILSATIYLADIATFSEMNAAWDAWVDRENPPARATVEARLVAPEYRVEIAVTAARGKS